VPTASKVKVKLAGERPTAGELGIVPMPLNATVCGLPDALSVTETAPLALPATVGATETLIEHVPAAGIVDGQLLVCAKPEATDIEEITSDAVPVLVSVTDCGWLVVLMSWLPKLTLDGEKEIAGAVGGGVDLEAVSVPLPQPMNPHDEITRTASKR
jgi:hypothetical protein